MRKNIKILAVTLVIFCYSFILSAPVHAYDIDTHYAWTYYLALQVGYTDRQAYQIASAAQAIDNNKNTGPLEATVLDTIFGAERDFLGSNETVVAVWKNFHCFAGWEDEDKYRKEVDNWFGNRDLTIAEFVGWASNLDGKVDEKRRERANNLRLLSLTERNPGPLLHFSQDCFSHYEFNTIRGHAAVGHAPDWLSFDSAKAQAVTKKTVEVLSQFMRDALHQEPKTVDYDRVFKVLDRVMGVNPLENIASGRRSHIMSNYVTPALAILADQEHWDTGATDYKGVIGILRRVIAKDEQEGRLQNFPERWFDRDLPYEWIRYDYDKNASVLKGKSPEDAAKLKGSFMAAYPVEKLKLEILPDSKNSQRVKITPPAKNPTDQLYTVEVKLTYELSGVQDISLMSPIPVWEECKISDFERSRIHRRDQYNGKYAIEAVFYRTYDDLKQGNLTWDCMVQAYGLEPQKISIPIRYDKEEKDEEQPPEGASPELLDILNQLTALQGQASAIASEGATSCSDGKAAKEQAQTKMTDIGPDAAKLDPRMAKVQSSVSSVSANVEKVVTLTDGAYQSGLKAAQATSTADQESQTACENTHALENEPSQNNLGALLEQVRSACQRAKDQAKIVSSEVLTAKKNAQEAQRLKETIVNIQQKLDDIQGTVDHIVPQLETIKKILAEARSSLTVALQKKSEFNDIKTQAAGLLGQAQSFAKENVSPENKAVLGDIRSLAAQIDSTGAMLSKCSDKDIADLDSVQAKLDEAEKAMQEALPKLEALVQILPGREVIYEVEGKVEEAQASYEAADLFPDKADRSVTAAEICLKNAEQMHKKKTSPEAQLAQWDCSQWPGTVARWSAEKKTPYCECTPGNLWDDRVNSCISEEDYYMARIDCSNYSNAHPEWRGRKALCYCNQGYEWNNAGTNCRVSAQVQVSRTDCSAYPNTNPTWDAGNETVMCYCVQGFVWDGSRCVQQQPQYPQGGGQDIGQLIGGMVDIYNQGTGGGSGSNTGGGQTWGGGNASGGSAQQAQGDPCERNYSMQNMYMECRCSGYVWSTSQNKCVPGTGNTSGQTVPGFHGFPDAGGGSTGSQPSNTGGGSTWGGTPGEPCVYTGDPRTCDPKTGTVPAR